MSQKERMLNEVCLQVPACRGVPLVADPATLTDSRFEPPACVYEMPSGYFIANWSKSMDTLRNENMIKLARDAIDLVILRLQVEAMTNNRVNRQNFFRLSCARKLLAECNATVVLQ
jgi:hypothetical protein